MRKITIVCVGKIKERYLTEGIAEYVKRMTRFCEPKIVQLDDCPDRPDAVTRESTAVLKRLTGRVVLTDIGGEPITSNQLAEELDRAFASGAGEITFVIGGSSGVDERVRARADRRISFGRVTYPHRLMRLILCEQLYRAFTILDHMPYHK